VPWHHHIIVGTTDTPVDAPTAEPVAGNKEIDFILDTISRYLVRTPRREDVLSVFAGLRPLIAGEKKIKSTKELSRDHKLLISDSGMITITGGKWTTYRKMAEDTVNAAIKRGGLKPVACPTKDLRLNDKVLEVHPGSIYPQFSDNHSAEYFVTREVVQYAIKYEMARTIDDVLARRLRILFLNAREAKKAAVQVAEYMDRELGWGNDRKEKQLKTFEALADHYLVLSETK
jgi:glycerol-3-phosphate dehydrogenase